MASGADTVSGSVAASFEGEILVASSSLMSEAASPATGEDISLSEPAWVDMSSIATAASIVAAGTFATSAISTSNAMRSLELGSEIGTRKGERERQRSCMALRKLLGFKFQRTSRPNGSSQDSFKWLKKQLW